MCSDFDNENSLLRRKVDICSCLFDTLLKLSKFCKKDICSCLFDTLVK